MGNDSEKIVRLAEVNLTEKNEQHQEYSIVIERHDFTKYQYIKDIHAQWTTYTLTIKKTSLSYDSSHSYINHSNTETTKIKHLHEKDLVSLKNTFQKFSEMAVESHKNKDSF
jgi:hypothetical protein